VVLAVRAINPALNRWRLSWARWRARQALLMPCHRLMPSCSPCGWTLRRNSFPTSHRQGSHRPVQPIGLDGHGGFTTTCRPLAALAGPADPRRAVCSISDAAERMTCRAAALARLERPGQKKRPPATPENRGGQRPENLWLAPQCRKDPPENCRGSVD